MSLIGLSFSHEIKSPRDSASDGGAFDAIGAKTGGDGGADDLFFRESGIGGYKVPGDGDGTPGGTPGRGEIYGTGDDDYLDFSDHTDAEAIYSFAGDDTVMAGSGDTKIFGGLGNDEIYGGAGADTVVGGDGDDILFGGLNADEIHAGEGADIVAGGKDDDLIFLTDDDMMDRVLFQIGDGDDIVDGFETGVDQVEISGGGLGFGDLTITYNVDGTQALVEIAPGDSILFTGLDGALDAGDFLF